MIKIKTKDNSYLEIEKEKLIGIDFFKHYLSDKFNDNKNEIEMDYDKNIIEYLILYINNDK